MSELLNMWQNNRAFFSEKKLSQIISIAGDGNIESDETCSQVRELFGAIPTDIIKKYVEDCLVGFDKSGFVLQDLVNEIGSRIGFEVEHGHYRGSSKKNGLDGLWISPDSAIVVEVKTTDAYRINLSTLDKYKRMLIEKRPELAQKVSILIVAGRQDTGDLEAQIRGSRYAWDIRLISIDSLLKLLDLKEAFNDVKTIRQINKVLIPQEYTRLDKLIDLIFLSAQDAELDDSTISAEKAVLEGALEPEAAEINDRMKFYSDCADKLGKKFETPFLKRAKTLYDNAGVVGVIINISKQYIQGGRPKYWFAYHPYFKENLSGYDQRYILYGCGTAEHAFLLPVELIEDNKAHMWSTTRSSGSTYWHVNIFLEKDGKYYLHVPVGTKDQWICVDEYMI